MQQIQIEHPRISCAINEPVVAQVMNVTPDNMTATSEELFNEHRTYSKKVMRYISKQAAHAVILIHTIKIHCTYLKKKNKINREMDDMIGIIAT